MAGKLGVDGIVRKTQGKPFSIIYRALVYFLRKILDKTKCYVKEPHCRMPEARLAGEENKSRRKEDKTTELCH